MIGCTQFHRYTSPTCSAQGGEHIREQHDRINLFLSRLDERQRRWYAGLESLRYSHGSDRFAAELSAIEQEGRARRQA